jgi:hypothetical protein
MKQPDKLIALARRELPSLADSLIVAVDGGYQAFGKYQIRRQGNVYTVQEQSVDRGTFGSTRSALSWCIADKYHQYDLALRIRQLDERSTWARECIETRENLAKRSTPEFQSNISVKLQHRQAVKYQIDLELEKCVKKAKYLQNRGFTNDTQRTSPSGSRKTSR